MSRSLIVALPIFIVYILLPNRASGYEQFSVDNYPNPTGSSAEDHWKCHVDRPGYVCDPDSLLNKTERMELVELADRFKEWTKMPTSDDFCAQQGVQLGIALSHYTIKGRDYHGIHFNSHSQPANWNSLFNKVALENTILGEYSARQRLNRMIEDTYKNEACESIALKWGLRKGNCSRYVLIQLSTTAIQTNVICSNVSVPISAPEKLYILTAAKGHLSRGEFLPALKAIIGNLLQLIVHRQSLFIGEKALGPNIGTAAAIQTEGITTAEPQDQLANLSCMLALLFIGLFFCLPCLMFMAMHVFSKLKKRRNARPVMEMHSLKKA